jgi:hypothetical protein
VTRSTGGASACRRVHHPHLASYMQVPRQPARIPDGSTSQIYHYQLIRLNLSEKSDLPRQAGGVMDKGCQACVALRGLVSMVGVFCQLRQGLACSNINWRQVGDSDAVLVSGG